MAVLKFLKDIAHILDDRCMDIPTDIRKQRIGRFTYYGEALALYTHLDDYTVEGSSLLVGAIRNARSDKGTLTAVWARGCYTPSKLFHTIQCDSEADLEYLRQIINNIEAKDHLVGTSMYNTLPLEQLELIMVPWPEPSLRKSFTRLSMLFDALENNGLKAVQSLFDRLDKCFTDTCASSPQVALSSLCAAKAGETLAPEAYNDSGRVSVVSAQGEVGYSDSLMSEGPCIVFGRLGKRLHAHWINGPTFATKDTFLLDQKHSALPLAYVFFALRMASDISEGSDPLNVPISLPDEARYRAFNEEAAAGIKRIESLYTEIQSFGELSRDLHSRLIKGDSSVIPLPDSEATDTESLKPPQDEQFDPPQDELLNPPHEDQPQEQTEVIIREKNPIISVFEAFDWGLGTEDAFWELFPLVFLRKLLKKGSWGKIMGYARSTDTVPRQLQAALDLGLDALAVQYPQVGFLPKLSYQHSLLSDELLRSLLLFLDDIDTESLSPETFAEAYATVLGAKNLLIAPPATYLYLIERLICAQERQYQSIYDPYSGSGALALTVARLIPAAQVLAQSPVLQDELVGRMVFALAGLSGSFHTADALADDLVDTSAEALADPSADPSADSSTDPSADLSAATQFPGEEADLVFCMPHPEKDKLWPSKTEATSDEIPLGVPRQARSLALWIQRALEHSSAGGTLIALVPNAFLHSGLSVGRQIRQNLVESGILECVISLPGRLFPTEKAPFSILIMQKAGPLPSDARKPASANAHKLAPADAHKPAPSESQGQSVLFMDLQGLGVELPGEWPTLRDMSRSDIDRIAACYRSWHTVHTIPSELASGSEMVKAVTADEIAAHEYLLTPWEYIDPVLEPPNPLKVKRPDLSDEYESLNEERQKLLGDLDRYLGLIPLSHYSH